MSSYHRYAERLSLVSGTLTGIDTCTCFTSSIYRSGKWNRDCKFNLQSLYISIKKKKKKAKKEKKERF